MATSSPCAKPSPGFTAEREKGNLTFEAAASAEAVQAHITALKGKAADGTISIGDAVSRAYTLHPAPERSPSYLL